MASGSSPTGQFTLSKFMIIPANIFTQRRGRVGQVDKFPPPPMHALDQ